MKNQKGMTLIGWILVISIFLVLAMATLRLVPVYLQYFRINAVLLDLPNEMESNRKVNPKAIHSYLSKRFDIEAITVIAPKDVKVVRNNEAYDVTAAYEHKVPFLGNINFAVDFRKSVKVLR